MVGYHTRETFFHILEDKLVDKFLHHVASWNFFTENFGIIF